MIDRVFSNRYRLVEKIGIGGMAEVYKAADEVLGRTVAVKVMLPQYASDPTFAARFKQEAQSAANLQSPYIVNIYDWGHDDTDNTYFIAMEYVRGTDLKTAIDQRGAINPRKVAEIGSQVCAALGVAHGYDIIHRDIKPHNIMVQPDGNAKVMDFGIARANGSTMTQTGSVLGTAYYVSPEQAQGKPLTAATDLYSLGVVLYEATTGRVPFDAPDAVAVALKQVNEQPVPPRRFNPDIDPELETIILRAMAKNPLERFTTAEQMRTALNNYLAGRPVDAGVDAPAAQTRVLGSVTSLPVIGRDGAQPPVHTAVMPSVGGVGGSTPPLVVRSTARAKEEEKRKSKNRMIIIAVAAALLAIVIIGVVIYALNTSGTNTVEVPTVVGMTEQEAKDELTRVKLTPGKVTLEASPTVEEGRVISSNPSAKTKVKEESTVDLVVSSGPEKAKTVTVPDLKTKTRDDADKTLEALELMGRRGDDKFDPEIPAGQVCAQDPAPGTTVDVKTVITYNISKGKDTGVVPNVVGVTEQEARDYLTNYDFNVEVAEAEYSDDYDEGIVMRQDPRAAETRDKGTTVTITVSRGSKPIPVPDLSGLSLTAATNKLSDLGLKISAAEQTTELASQLDTVVGQDPAAGTEVKKGDTITVYIGIRPPTPPPPTP